MSNVGQQLREAREAQNKTRADVAGATGILIHDLAALEHGSFDALPDDETVAGYVKAYAEHLGFRADEPVAEFWAERGVDPPPSPSPAPAEARTATEAVSRRLRWGWILAALAVAVLAVLWLVGREDPTTTPATTGVATEAPAEPAPSPPETVHREQPEEVVEPTPPPASLEPAPAAPATGLRVVEHAVGRDVRDRRLIGESDRFRPGDRVWFWTRVAGGGEGDSIRHVWIHEGREIETLELDVGSASWRTWSVKTMLDGAAGRWTVEARDVSGRTLARREFSCEP